MKSLAPRARKGGVLQVVLIVVGVVVLLGIVLLVAGGWYAKTKIDAAGGLQSFASQMMGKGIEMMKPELDKALQEGDRARLAGAIQMLQEKGASLTPEQIEAISDAVQKLSQQAQGGSLSETQALAFVDELVRQLTPAAPGAEIPAPAPEPEPAPSISEPSPPPAP